VITVNTKNKRLDFEFLRGIAVIIVFLFHYNQQIFPYYFVGVDLFFLISGYVITKSILLNKNFNLFEFYLKRIKRIYPALIVILTIYITYFLRLTDFDGGNYLDTVFSTLSTIFAVSNYFYAINPNYFYFSPEIKNLHHTWSLSVEIQFYVFIGLFLFLLNFFNSLKTKSLIYFLLSIFIVSLLLFITSNNKFLSGYYAFPGRLWEFLLGGIIYMYQSKKKFLNFHLLIIIFLSSILMLGIINPEINYKIIVFFSIIYFSIVMTFSNFYNFFIIDKILIFFGKISFSFYLWHLIILTFFKNTFTNIYLDFSLNFFASFLFSFLTFILIEEKFNKKLALDKYLIKALKFFTFTSLIVVLYCTIINQKFIFDVRDLIFQKSIQSFNKLKKPILDIDLFRGEEFSLRYDACSNKYENFNWFNGTNCLIDNSNHTLFYIMGDSYGDHIVPTIASIKNKITLYKARLNNCYISKGRTCNVDNLDTIISQFLDISKNFKETFLIISVNHASLSESKIKKLLKFIEEDFYIIVMYRHPSEYEYTNSENFKKYIMNKKQDYLILDKLKKDKKIYFFDNLKNLCADCNNQEYKNFFSQGRGHHFTLKTSLNLRKNFERFILEINTN
jgi:peptidoglycan/LPS O-acetylase OafA/YrhL